MNGIKKITWMLCMTALTLMALDLTGCREQSETSTLHLTMGNPSETERTISPPNVPLEVTRYVLQGTGPKDHTFSMESTSSSMTVEGLAIGQWKLHAVGRNEKGLDLVEGEKTITLTKEPATVVIPMATLSGRGTLTIGFVWDPENIRTPSIKTYLTDMDGTTTELQPTIKDLANGSVTYSEDYPAGSYTLQTQLYSGTIVAAGCAQAIRIVGNKVTEATIRLDLDEQAPLPSTVELINKAGVPIECSVTGLSKEMPANTTSTASLDISDVEDPEALDIQWFLDGKEVGTGRQCPFTPSSGLHRLDVVASGTLLASSGSSSFPFRAEVMGTTGIPVPVTVLHDAENGLLADGICHIAFLPDGNLLVSSSEHNTLQICRIIRDSLEVMRTYRLTDDFNTEDITDMLVDPVTYRVAIADSKHPGIALYRYDTQDTSLTKLFYRDNVMYKATSGPITFSATGTLALDNTNGYLYCCAPGSTNFPWSDMHADTQEEFQLYQYTYWFRPPFEEVAGIAIAPGGNKAAFYSEPDNLVDFCIRDVNGFLFTNSRAFSEEENATHHLQGIQTVGFLNDDCAVTGSTDALCVFHNSEHTQWEQSQIWLSGQNGIPSMKGICDTETLDGTFLYALCKDSRNIQNFAIGDDAAQPLSYLGATDLQSFTPSEFALSPDGTYLVVASKTDNALMLCRIPQ